MNKTCLVVGAGSDIGAAVVVEMASAGYDVIGTYCHTHHKSLPCKLVQLDLVSDPKAWSIQSELPKQLDIVVTSSFPFIESTSFDDTAFERANTFLRGHMNLLCMLRPRMSAGGTIFNMLGQCVERGLSGAPFYSAAFAFMHNWGNSVNSLEGKSKTGISVCNFLLGPVDTRAWDEVSSDIKKKYKEKVRAFVSAKEVAQHVSHFAAMEIKPSTFKLDSYYGY